MNGDHSTAGAPTPPHSPCHCCLLANRDRCRPTVAAARRRLLFDCGLDSDSGGPHEQIGNRYQGFTVNKISPNTQSTPIPASIGQYPVPQYQYRSNPNVHSSNLCKMYFMHNLTIYSYFNLQILLKIMFHDDSVC